MTKSSSIFSELDTSVKTPVRIGNRVLMESKGKSTIAVQTKRGTKFIKDVLYVPELNQNLLCVAQMMQHGYSVHFEGYTCVNFVL